LFESFWNHSLHDGVVTISNDQSDATSGPATANGSEAEGEEETQSSLSSALLSAAGNVQKSEGSGGEWELTLYEKTGIGNGSHANNPWLQELPDPVSKVCWDNYITMNPTQMKELGLNTILGQVQEAAVVKLSVNGTSIQAPVYPQYGQARGTIGLALGYGRAGAGKTGDEIGTNAYPFCSFENGILSYVALNASIGKQTGEYHLATTQTHHTMMGSEGNHARRIHRRP